MRIVHVMDHSLPKGDGYSIRAKYLLEAQVARGHEITVLTSPSQGPDAMDDVIGGVTYRRSHYSAFERRLVARGGKHMVFGRAVERVLGELLADDRFDLVHAHTPFTVGRVGLRVARKRGIPFIYEKRNLWEESARARGKLSGRWPWYSIAQALDRRVTREADAICTITHALRARTLKLGAGDDCVTVVGNGVDTDAFRPQPPPTEVRARCLAGGRFVIGFIGSFYSFEGLPMLVEACRTLCSRYPDLRLVLVGDGEDRARIAEMVARLNLERNVWMVGRVAHSQVLDFYSAMDILTYPRYPSALTEMISPLKPLEPMAMGKCVVGSDVGGIRELIRHNETGLLFRAGAIESLIEALDGLVSGRQDAHSLGSRARAYVVACRQWRHMAESYEIAYQHAQRQPS